MKNYAFTAVDRFLQYVQIDTQSDPHSPTNPSTEKQKDLSQVLVQELLDLVLGGEGWDGAALEGGEGADGVGEAAERGANVCISSWNRLPPNTMPAIAKAGGNYMNAQLMKMEAIRNGARGLDELTNHVVSITNFWRDFDTTTEPWTPLPPPVAPDGYTATRSYVTSATVPNDAFPLTNGAYIVGLLSKPKLDGINNTTVRSNHVVAVVRAITGAASDKYPQTNVSVLDLGLTYRMVAEVHNVRLADSAGNNAQAVRANLHELRLKFSWPVFPGNKLGKGRQTFRTMAGGQILTAQPNGQPVFFFVPAPY